MNNLFKFIVPIAIALLAVSCVKETNTETVLENFRRYSISIDQPTKTNLSGTGSKRQVVWNDGDAIKYYTESGQSSASSATVSSDGSSAYVYIRPGRSDEFINAVYGATQLNSGSSSSDCMYVNSPAKDSQSYTSFSDAHICAAFSDDIENPNLHFHNAAAILKFTSSASVHKVVFRGNNDEVITGGSNGSLKITRSGGAINTTAASSGGTSVTVVTAGSETDYYIAIIPVSFTGGISIDCYDANNEIILIKKTESTIKTISNSGAVKILDLGSVRGWFSSTPPVAVDLGLSVKWACFNVGATVPEDSGAYFAWGETAPKADYQWSNYIYEHGSGRNGPFSKYVLDSKYGTVDHKTILDLDDDAAQAEWGDVWRMPTKEEFDELKNNCTWTWTQKNGVNGYRVTSNVSGFTSNSIFLPANGIYESTSVSDAGTDGNYWTSSLSPDGTYFAFSPYFSSSDVKSGNCYRYFGLGVRPVYGAVVPVESISIPEELDILVDSSETLMATILPSNATYKNVTWSSSDESIATVNADGKVTAVAPGEVTVTVYSADGGISAECLVISNQLAQSITLDKASIEMYVGDEPVTITATVLPEENTIKSVTWTTSNKSIVIVDQDGKVTAVANGTATITATAKDGSNASASCSATVKTHVKSVSLNNTEITLYNGKTASLTATVLPSAASNKSITWTSSDNNVATVIGSGSNATVKGKSRGTAIISAITVDGNFTASCNVTVEQYVQSITLDKTSIEMFVGDEPVSIIPTILPDNASDKSISWASSNSSVATVNSDGKVTAISSGSTKVTATANGGRYVKATCTVRVYAIVSLPASVEAVDLGLPSGLKWATMNVGATKPEEYGEYYAWGETQPKWDYDWSTYKWCNGDYNKLTKYCRSNKTDYWDGSGSPDNKTVLDPEDDAAHVNWGGSWRMPTDAECNELLGKCTWTWTTQNGVNGLLVTSKTNGNSIFLPAAGYMSGTYFNAAGTNGYYWSSSLTLDYPTQSYEIGFDSSEDTWSYFIRYYGYTVRPVSE